MKNPTLFAFLVLALTGAATFAQENNPASFAGVHGGLILQLGAEDVDTPAMLSQTGRYVIHIVETEADAVPYQRLREKGRYGLVWAEHRPDVTRLPYAENVVNGLMVERDFGIKAEEFARVLTPGAPIVLKDDSILTVAQLEAAGFESITTKGGITATKKWPTEMDGWSHTRHGSGGNAVSKDTAVGPPERVRWVAAATWEVEGLVSAGGRNFYGGTLARNSFNGLRLWHRDLTKGDEPNAAEFKLPRIPATNKGARPVASEEVLFAVMGGKVVALDSASGEVKVDFSGVEQPRALMFDEGTVVAAGVNAVHGFNAETGKELWKIEAAEPHDVVAGNGLVSFIHGRPKRGEKSEAVTIELASGNELWRKNDFPWLDRTTRTVLYVDHLAFEVSTFNDHDKGNAIHIVHSQTGEFAWQKEFAPGMNHARQARAMFLEDAMWILHGGKINTETDQKGRIPVEVSALELESGEVMVTHPAGLAHCFPPVATPNFMFAGELDLTDLRSGDVVANRITKANCSRENGWTPANGLIYTTPKHCTCWPMLRGFVAMAPAAAEDNPAMKPIDEIQFQLEAGPAKAPKSTPAQAGDWPVYRHDKWRSGSSKLAGPANLEIAWRTQILPTGDLAALAHPPTGPILHDWNENPYIKGPLSAPIVANGMAFLARPDAHEVLAVKIDGSGEIVWRANTNGRVDSPPSYHNGLVLFGTHNGYVSALRADTGEQVWRLNAAPTDERIVAYGQVESPWPVPGSVLIDEDVAYFVAGRQELADGGVMVFAVDPMTGEKHWVHRIDELPQQGYYENSGLEFDPVDIPFVEGDKIAMSRWLITKDGKESSVDKWNAFAKVNVDGEGLAWVPRGFWTYGARHQYRFGGEAPKRPLCVFRGKRIVGQLNGSTTVYMRDYDLENGEDFESKWITGWAASGMARKGDKPYRSHRIAEEATWKVDPFRSEEEQKALAEQKPGTQVWNDVYGMVLAGDDRVFMVHKDGRIVSINTESGEVLAEAQVPNPVWDSLVLAGQQLLLTTMDGELVCVGSKQ
ncbi:MAG: outer membrane protein assembly factor BamB [Verrucomicrobiales bacterium]|jgi:outer membrane protein assembly factor BamB